MMTDASGRTRWISIMVSIPSIPPGIFRIDKTDRIVGALSKLNGLLAVGGSIDAISVFSEPRSHGFAHYVFIVDDKNWPAFFHTPPSRDAKRSAICTPQREQYCSDLVSTIPMCVERLIAHFCSEQWISPKVCPISCSTSLVRRSRRRSSLAGRP